MTASQKREAVKLIRNLCSYCDNGNCIYLDRGETVVCPQSISYTVCCKFFRNVLVTTTTAIVFTLTGAKQLCVRRVFHIPYYTADYNTNSVW
jgi:hypothetical protein